MFSFSNRLSILRRRGLAYPAGFAPGFDPSHTASVNVQPGTAIAAVSVGGNFVNCLSGASATIVNSPAAKIIGGLGPSTSFTSTAKCTYPALTSLGLNKMTLAVIVQFISLTAAYQRLIGDITSFISLNASGVVDFFSGGDHLTSPAFTATINVPYFIAISTSATALNFVILNLVTGALISQSLAGVSVNPNGAINIGNNPPNNQVASAYIAAVMYAQNYLSVPQLLTWAADPWSFWYPSPQSLDMQVGTAVIPPPGLIASGWAETIW